MISSLFGMSYRAMYSKWTIQTSAKWTFPGER